jgi:hypothetical protein
MEKFAARPERGLWRWTEWHSVKADFELMMTQQVMIAVGRARPPAVSSSNRRAGRKDVVTSLHAAAWDRRPYPSNVH